MTRTFESLDHRNAERGISLLEALVTLVLLVAIVGVVLNLTLTAKDAQTYGERLSRATEINQRVTDEMRAEMLSAVDLVQAGTVGDGYLAALQLDPTSPLLLGSKLPTVFLTGTFERETTPGERTGNVLLFARQAWTTELTCASTATYQIDVYRLVCYYLTPEEGGPVPGSPLGLNLSKFVSEPLVDADQIDRISDPDDQEEVLVHLANGTPDDLGVVHPRAVLVWLRGGDLAVLDNVREIDAATGALSSTPLAPRAPGAWTIHRSPEHSNRGLLYYRHFSVASNYGHRRLGVARFGVKSSAGEGFPHGFEVQMGGLSSARQVLIHLSIVTTSSQGTRAHSDMRSVAFVQDV